MSAKYDLLASSKISDFDAVDVSNTKSSKKTSWRWQRCVVVGVVIALLVIAALTLVIVVVVEASKSRSSPSSPTDTPSHCPSDPPSVMVPCTSSKTAGTEDQCIDAGCCWYADQCVVRGYIATCTTHSNEMFTCLPENDNWNDTYARTMCNKRGCCWNPSAHSSDDPPVKCYYPSEYGYRTIEGGEDMGANPRVFTLDRSFLQPSMYSNDVQKLTVEITGLTNDIARIKIYDPAHQRYEVPLKWTSSFDFSQRAAQESTTYSIEVTNDNFSFHVTRTNQTNPIFKTAPGLVFSEQFLQLSAHLSSGYLYGLGEHATPWRLDTNYSKLTMFSRDVPPDPVNDINRNLYGVHPFYLNMEEGGQAHGVFLANSNAMEVELLPYPAITYRTIGGVLDLYFFMGPTPEDVVKQYTMLIGRPHMPPYWTLGFHLCRWGYLTANRTREVVERMRERGIPQDTQWNDIDYMNAYLDFTYNHTSFRELPQLVEDLHAHGQRYVVITDPGISATQPVGGYPPFDDGVSQGVFILNSTNQPILGTVWPGVTAYPDFTNPMSEQYWSNEISKFHDNVGFDGLWIDMNEPSNFVPGSTSLPPCPASPLNTPPFLPTAIRQSSASDKLIDKTLCMTSIQHYSSHYNVHSLYGHTESIATMKSLEGVFKRRSLVISRSTFPGSGTSAGHWLGDNASQWPHIKQSIPGILNFALFGIPLVGADICGFFDDTTEQLCTRWQQLGAFYPFSRNHNSYNANPQDPTQFSDYSINSTRDVLLIRYKLLPFLYTLFYHAHTSGSTVARPLLSVFPSDQQTWSNGRQFMWGDALLISPVITENATSVTAYFPQARWFDYRTGDEMLVTGDVTLDTPLNYIPLHVKGGTVIPRQQPETTTHESRKNPFSILVCLDNNDNAIGDLFIDDGEQLNSIENGNYTLLQFNVTEGQLQSKLVHNGYNPSLFLIDTITVYGMTDQPLNVTHDNKPLPPGDWEWSDNVFNVGVAISYEEAEFTIEWD